VTPSYLGRLLLLSSASFFLVQIVLGAFIALLAPAAIRRAGSMRPDRAAGFLLTLRLLPAAFSAIVVALWCVPSYLRFEPRVAEENVGFPCLAAAAFGALLCAFAIWRTLAALIRSSRYVHRCDGFQSRVAGETVWIVNQSAGLALAGILHPRLLISAAALRQLSADQLDVALRHERAHRASLDNLKRLLIVLVPLPGLRALEQAWAKCAEWAADDRAANGDADRSAALAEALVRVARLQGGIRMPALVTSLVEADEDLAQRVDRLLQSPVYESNRRIGTIALSLATVLIFSIALNPGSLRIVHHLLEQLLD
jgi:beta-lactamase regulating signal transducer with metallopeptidase domain